MRGLLGHLSLLPAAAVLDFSGVLRRAWWWLSFALAGGGSVFLLTLFLYFSLVMLFCKYCPEHLSTALKLIKFSELVHLSMAECQSTFFLGLVLMKVVAHFHCIGGSGVVVFGFFWLLHAILIWSWHYGWELNFYFRFFGLTLWSVQWSHKFHIWEYCLKAVPGHFPSLLCWSFSMLPFPAMRGFLRRPRKALIPATLAWLYPAGIQCSWQSCDHAPRNGQWYPWGHRGNTLSAIMNCSAWSCWSDAEPPLHNPCCGCLT